MPVVYENEKLELFPSINAGSSAKVVEISQLTEDELENFIDNQAALDEFLSDLGLKYIEDLDYLIVVRTQIIEHENDALDYFHKILFENNVFLSDDLDVEYG